MAVSAASGYAQLSGNLINPKFSMKLIERFYCSSVIADISVTDYSGEINNCGDQITFFREPEVQIQNLEKDGKLEHQTLLPDAVTMSVDNRLAFSVKIDRLDVQQMCNWEKWKESSLKRAVYNMNQQVDKILLTSLYADVDPRNKGSLTSAGYNFGRPTAPLVLTSANILQVLSQLHAQLCTLCASGEDMFVVLPCEAMPVLMNSPILSQAFASGLAGSALLNGKLPTMIAGFHVYFSVNVGTALEGAVPAFFIIAGRRDSTGFVMSNTDDFRIIEDKDDPDKYFQGFVTWGSKVIRKEGLVGLYATLA
jgi:hypothetical protein